MKTKITDHRTQANNNLAGEIANAIFHRAPDRDAQAKITADYHAARAESENAALLWATRTLYEGVEKGRWPWSKED